MQSTDRFWTLLGAVLAGEFFFGILYAALVRWLSKKEVEGQTAYLVVLGVFVSVAISIPLLGLPAALLALACFIASGMPMIVEYAARVHQERHKDKKDAQKVAKDLLK